MKKIKVKDLQINDNIVNVGVVRAVEEVSLFHDNIIVRFSEHSILLMNSFSLKKDTELFIHDNSG